MKNPSSSSKFIFSTNKNILIKNVFLALLEEKNIQMFPTQIEHVICLGKRQGYTSSMLLEYSNIFLTI